MFRTRSVRRAVLTAATAAFLSAATLLLTSTSAQAGTGIAGVDVSGWQHPGNRAIDFRAVKASGRAFVFVKATEGTGYVNPWFSTDRAAARTAGLAVGPYHLARPSLAAGSAVAQARWFVHFTGGLNNRGDLPAVLDLEYTGGLNAAQLNAWAATWLSTVKALTHRTPILYTYPNFFQTALSSSNMLAGYPLWIAYYSADSTPPSVVTATWPQWTFWQTSNLGSVPGITGAVDLDVFSGSAAQLDQLANRPTGPATTAISATLSATTVRAGGHVTMSGRVATFHAGETVYRQGYYSGAWHTWATAKVAANGTYSFTITPTVVTTDVYRIWVPATGWHAASASATLNLKVTP